MNINNANSHCKEANVKVFVWAKIEECTSNYHSEGGVVVFAKDEARARKLAKKHGCQIKDTEKPNAIRKVVGDKEDIYIMPNAGCC